MSEIRHKQNGGNKMFVLMLQYVASKQASQLTRLHIMSSIVFIILGVVATAVIVSAIITGGIVRKHYSRCLFCFHALLPFVRFDRR